MEPAEVKSKVSFMLLLYFHTSKSLILAKTTIAFITMIKTSTRVVRMIKNGTCQKCLQEKSRAFRFYSCNWVKSI